MTKQFCFVPFMGESVGVFCTISDSLLQNMGAATENERIQTVAEWTSQIEGSIRNIVPDDLSTWSHTGKRMDMQFPGHEVP